MGLNDHLSIRVGGLSSWEYITPLPVISQVNTPQETW